MLLNHVEKTRNCNAAGQFLPPEANLCRWRQEGEKIKCEIHLTISQWT